MTEFLTTEDLLTLTNDLGVGPVRDLGLLESAAHRPTATLWGQEAYPSLELKAAALLDSIANNHPLVDGNKRLGWLATLVFLDLNSVWIEAPDDDAYDLVIAVASESIALAQIAETMAVWSRPHIPTKVNDSHGRSNSGCVQVRHPSELSAPSKRVARQR